MQYGIVAALGLAIGCAIAVDGAGDTAPIMAIADPAFMVAQAMVPPTGIERRGQSRWRRKSACSGVFRSRCASVT